jgi:Ca-activated chloride channel family protein
MPEAFHFQQPAWFLALLPLALLIWRVRRHGSADSAWRRVCDANLLPYLLINPLRAESRWPLWLLAAGWLIAVIALADPVWEKMPQPVFRTEAARVVVLDLSRSMNSADLKPSRLERARYKVEDVLRRSEEGQVGLVVFAGDAFVVAPLTQDARTITEQLKALEPGLMPVQGSRVDRGLRKAGELLKQAGAGRGEILLITDGYEGDQALEAARELQRQGDTVSVLGVGTKEGAPLSDGAGGFVQDDKGTVVVPRLDVASLRALANAGGGRYATITGNNADLNALLTPLVPRLNAKVEQTGLKTDAWRSRGPWLVVLLLPLAALGFRRGWLLGVVLLVVATVTPPQPAMASTWDDLWTRRDQQAAQALAAGEDARAAELATDPQQRGTAQYRAGQYEQSLESFSKATGPDAAYNQGNALARLGRYKEAIAAYDRALATQPHMEDAQHNKAVIEKLLQQQEEKKRQQQQQQGQQSGQSQSGEGQQQGNGDKSSTPSAQQEAQQKNGKSKDDSASQAANGNEARGDKAGKSPADAAPGSQDKSQANDEAAARNEAQPAGQKGAEPRDEHAAANTGQSSTPDTKKNPETIPEGNDSKSQAQAAGQESPKVEHQAAAERPAGEEPAENPVPSGAQAASDTHSTEEQQATEQWLRRIPDDPGGLLRRKFLYQYRQRAAGADRDVGQSW